MATSMENQKFTTLGELKLGIAKHEFEGLSQSRLCGL
jgi:hypothetical protein